LTGLYEDTGLVNGTTYFYMVRPRDLNGNVGAPSRIFWGTPKADPIPPIGSVIINDGAPFAASVAATLSLVASLDVDDVLIGNDPGFAGAVWQPFASALPWTLVPHPSTGVATVHVKLRDVNGNESPSVYDDSVTVLAASSLGRVLGSVSGEGLAGLAGISIRVAAKPELPPVYTDAQGDFAMRYLPPGSYQLIVERHGYESVVVSGVVVPAGGSIDVGEIELSLQDVVVPNAALATEAASNNYLPFATIFAPSLRYQQIYDASQFPWTGPIPISAIAFRPDQTANPTGGPLDLEIWLSTTSAAPDALSATFAQNVGPDAVLVFDDTIALSTAVTPSASAPKNFDIVIPLATPFPYDPTQGNLLLDLRNRTPSGVFLLADAASSSSDPVSRVVTQTAMQGTQTADSPTGQTDSAGLVTRFGLPEPAAGASITTAALSLWILKRIEARRRRRDARR
jgi:hypothetical protein